MAAQTVSYNIAKLLDWLANANKLENLPDNLLGYCRRAKTLVESTGQVILSPCSIDELDDYP